MPAGGCFCDKIRISYTGEPEANMLCHCLDCRKISGSSYSCNIVVDDSNFKLEKGTPKSISKIADSGKKITSYFCGDCGTTLFRKGEFLPGKHVVKYGVMDDPDWPKNNVPKMEIYASHKVPWWPQIEGASQVDCMPS